MLDKIIVWDHQTLVALNQIVSRYPAFDFLFKFLAVGLIYLVPAILLVGYFWSKEAKKVMIMAGAAGLVAWQIVGKLAGAVYFRPRPFANQSLALKEIIFHRPDYSFPSDHALFLGAICAVFWAYGYRKLAILMTVVALLVSLMRVMVGLHYPLDVLIGLALGGLIGIVFFWQKRFLERYFVAPLEKAIFKLIRH